MRLAGHNKGNFQIAGQVFNLRTSHLAQQPKGFVLGLKLHRTYTSRDTQERGRAACVDDGETDEARLPASLSNTEFSVDSWNIEPRKETDVL
jgi:hypothetical protein